MVVYLATGGSHRTASNRHLWIGRPFLNLSDSNDNGDVTKVPTPQVTAALDESKVRAMLVTDLENPFTPKQRDVSRILGVDVRPSNPNFSHSPLTVKWSTACINASAAIAAETAELNRRNKYLQRQKRDDADIDNILVLVDAMTTHVDAIGRSIERNCEGLDPQEAIDLRGQVLNMKHQLTADSVPP
jgi:hypothetical protein